METAYLLTGGNEGDRVAYLQEAARQIAAGCGAIRAASALYETAAWGKTDQPAFLNQALALETSLPPQVLLQRLLAIEAALGRHRTERYGPRTIDIDILLFGNRVIHESGLSIPHPQLPVRRFALTCLHDIAPAIIHPEMHQTIAALLAHCPDSLTVHKLPPPIS